MSARMVSSRSRHDARHVDFEQQIGAALQVEAEIDRGARAASAGIDAADILGQEIRQREEEPEKRAGRKTMIFCQRLT